MSVQEQNKQTCRDYFQAFLARDTAWMAKHIAPDFIRNDPGLPFQVKGPEGASKVKGVKSRLMVCVVAVG